MNINKLLPIIAYIFLSPKLLATPVIQISFKSKHPTYALGMVEKIRHKGIGASKLKLANTQAPAESGIFSIYSGFLKVSNDDGLIFFPRKHNNPLVYLMITEDITPVFMHGNTIHHWEFDLQKPHAMYTFSKENGIWSTKDNMPITSSIIPAETVVIVAKPHNLMINLNEVVTERGPHLILPTIHLLKNFNKAENSIYMLELINFFGTHIPTYKIDDKKYQSTVQP